LPGAGGARPKRDVFWTSQARQDLAYWERKDRRIARRIEQLVEGILSEPFSGIGKPEPLRYELAGYWSRRINKEHRLVYRVEGNTVFIAQCRFHYR
jgi:toxin YoeB